MFSERIRIKETDMLVMCDKREGIKAAFSSVVKNRRQLESYIAKDPYFRISLEPVKVPREAPKIARLMAKVGEIAGVGPMAAVAGAISQLAAEDGIRAGAKNIIAENGGDVCIIGDRVFVAGLYAGSSPLSKKIGLELNPKDLPLGICTSSGTVGHSISFGNADSVTVLSKSTPLADAAATAIGNRVLTRDEEGVKAGLEYAKKIDGIQGVIIIVGEIFASYGRIPKIIKTKEFDVVTG
jgi:hypothetical protein